MFFDSVIMINDYCITEVPLMLVAMALLGRFCIAAVFAVIILQTSELFPTVNRNSAIGTSLTVCQLGAIAAPYIVDGLVCMVILIIIG